MLASRTLGVLLCLGLISAAPARAAAGPPELVAEWNFDEGQGNLARDSSGNGHDARIGGAACVKQGSGFAISLDGFDDFIDGGDGTSIGITGPLTIEAWIRPMRKAHGMSSVIGEGLQSFLLSYYNTEVFDLYVADGSNSVRGKAELGSWNHVVAAFDGKTMNLWINGRLTGTRESKFSKYERGAGAHVMIGTKGQPALPKFKGMLDRVRIYRRALSAEEALGHFKSEAAEYGFDPAWFSRVRLTPHFYPDRKELIVQADYRGLQPLEGEPRIRTSLIARDKPQQELHHATKERLPAEGSVEITIPCDGLAAGEYLLNVVLEDGKGARPAEKLAFSHPPKPVTVPSPAERSFAPATAQSRPAPFDFVMNEAGGFTISVNGGSYAFQTRASWPNGEFNVLGAGGVESAAGEKNWRPTAQTLKEGRYQVEAGGASYRLSRDISVFPTHVYIKDTYTNTTDQDLGLLIYNEMPVRPGQITDSRLSGHEKAGRRAELGYPDYAPSVFVTDAHSGIAMLPIDDVFIVQSLTYVEEQAAGIGTERFALPPGQSYTLEWAVYPTGSKDYYDFINAFRKVENRIGTIDGGFGFISYGPMNRRQVPDADFFRNRGIKYGIISSLGRAADDPELSIEGIEFADFPKEMDLLKRQAALFHHRYPDKKVMFHVAHSLYLTNNPDRFADSKVITADGKQAVWSVSEPYVSKRRMEEGYNWYIYYPAPGNSFHDALMKSVDIMMDEMGMDGAFMDGFFAAYITDWSYDTHLRWDGHTAEIDPRTKTITRKMNSVLLLSQPSMIEFARKVRDKGGVVIGNGVVFTRTIASEKQIFFDLECASGPELHLAPSVTALMRPPVQNEQELYLDMLDKLSWGMLFDYFIERINLSGPSLAAKQFPITFEEIRSGMVRGKQRIVTMNDGVYAWPNDRQLHLVHKFDARGASASHDYLSTIDSAGTRTELKFKPNESAVIERIPVTIDSEMPLNASVQRYDGTSLRMLLNGRGDATLNLFVGTRYPDKRDGVLTDGGMNPAVVGVGAAYEISVNGIKSTAEERDGTLLVPLKLDGLAEISVAPAGHGR